jgi:hypothetical protein
VSLSSCGPDFSSSATAPILRGPSLGGESEGAFFIFFKLDCRKQTEISSSACIDDEAPAAMMLAWSLWLPRPILGLKESAYGDDGAPAAMTLAQQNDMQ